VIEVADDGRGITGPPGVGLTSMQERAAELGGALSAERRAGGGTVVRAQLPIEAP
jgi:two-component system, NarL family, sensor histidine kinase UhpB